MPNEDGTYTYVISATDPGVHNWIDSDGLREGILTLRMAEFPRRRPTEDLGARGRVVEARRPRRRGARRCARVTRRRARGRARRPARGVPAPPARRDDLTWRRWLITGCSTGIGREIARAALEAGH